jgi:hypothetical protein
MLLTLAGCSAPEIKPPGPMQSDVEGEIRQFKGFAPQQVLAAAEDVLRRRLPEAKFVRSADTLEVEWHRWGFLVIVGSYVQERWAVYAREEDQVTVASVAMSWSDTGFGLGVPGGVITEQFPNRSVRIDYGMFWHRVQSILTGAPWPECGALPSLSFFELLFREVNYYEPLCFRRTTNRYEAK